MTTKPTIVVQEAKRPLPLKEKIKKFTSKRGLVLSQMPFSDWLRYSLSISVLV